MLTVQNGLFLIIGIILLVPMIAKRTQSEKILRFWRNGRNKLIQSDNFDASWEKCSSF